jgi:uncharacterized protein YerC|tara:strand:- start:969 stop:1157 length:189 start_codon:yes stop_codon:yes gene_type:complete
MDTAMKIEITWVADDIATLREDWTMEQCEAFFDDIRNVLVDRSIECGWTVIETLLDLEAVQS